MRHVRIPTVLLGLLGLVPAMAFATQCDSGDTPAQPANVVSVEGVITEVARPFATFEANGASYRVHLGPCRYWVRKGYRLGEGDPVIVTGHLERQSDGTHLFPHSMVRNGETYTFLNENGLAYWRAPDGFPSGGCGVKGCDSVGPCSRGPGCKEGAGGCRHHRAGKGHGADKTLREVTASVRETQNLRTDNGQAWLDAVLDVEGEEPLRVRVAPVDVLRDAEFSLAPGDRVRVRVFVDEMPPGVSRIRKLATGEYLRLRCLSGEPIWSHQEEPPEAGSRH